MNLKWKALFLILIVSTLPTYGQTDDTTWLVQAVVVSVQKTPEDQTLSEMPNVPKDFQPLWRAELKIASVLRGPSSIKQSAIFVTTSEHIPLGNTRSIVPKLQIGDKGIFAIKRNKDGTLSRTYLQPIVEGATLPLIKGRHPDYDRVVERLSATSDKPTADLVSKGNTLDDGTTLSAPRQLALAPRRPDEATPTPEPDLKPSSSTPWSVIVILIVVASGLLWLLLKRRS